MSTHSVETDSEDLEALFDSIVRDKPVEVCVPESKVDNEVRESPSGNVMDRVGQLLSLIHI